MIVSNIKIDNIKNNTNIKDIIKKYYQNKTNKIIIINNNTNREIILLGDKNIKYNYNDTKIFDSIYLPELINFYLNNNIITNSIENDNEYNINNSLYLINYNKESLSYIKNYINIINKKNNFKLELNNNCIIEDDITPNIKKERIYSYGYINILLISLIIAVLTIIFCITRYY